MSTKNKTTTVPSADEVVAVEPNIEALQQELSDAQNFLQKARESELRVMADYQNLVRRTQDERMKLVKFASLTLMEKLLQPMDHLFLAKESLKDNGLNMVYQQFEQVLKSEGLEEISCVGQPFDLSTMEVVSKEKVSDQKQHDTVIKVVSKGYRLNGEVIRHAKVILGISE